MAALAVTLATVGCQNPVAPPPPPPSQPVTRNYAQEALQAVAERDCGRAAPLLRQAIGFDPDSIELRYNLAVCATHLDLRDEAVREFHWLLANATAGSLEARTARAWLEDAGELGSDEPATAAEPGEKAGTSGLAGTAVWADEGETPRPTRRLLLHLVGLPGTATEGQYYRIRTDENGRFEFSHVVAGPYKLTNRLAGPPMWRLKVELTPGRQTTVSLNPDNSAKTRDDFPEPTG